jgi:hypothetical protein
MGFAEGFPYESQDHRRIEAAGNADQAFLEAVLMDGIAYEADEDRLDSPAIHFNHLRIL